MLAFHVAFELSKNHFGLQSIDNRLAHTRIGSLASHAFRSSTGHSSPFRRPNAGQFSLIPKFIRLGQFEENLLLLGTGFIPKFRALQSEVGKRRLVGHQSASNFLTCFDKIGVGIDTILCLATGRCAGRFVFGRHTYDIGQTQFIRLRAIVGCTRFGRSMSGRRSSS